MSIIKTEFGAVSLELSSWPIDGRGNSGRRIRIHSTDDYVDTLDRYQALFDLAKQDFPRLTTKDVTPVVLGGMVHDGKAGIEFQPPEGSKVPSKYRHVGQSFPDPRR